MHRVLIVFVLALGGCGSPSTSSPPVGQASAASSATPASHTAAPEPPLPPGVETWKIYSSTDYGYALRYPPVWFSLGNFGPPTTEAYFSNHQDATSPMNLGTDGVFIVLSADCQYWLGPDTKLVSKSYVTIGSTSVQRYVVFDATPDGAFYAADADVSAQGSCYRLTMIGSLSAVQTNLSIYDLMLSSLRFFARTSPIASPHPTAQPSQSS